MDRRGFLALTGSATVALAGCSAPLGETGDGDPDGELLYSGSYSPTVEPGNFVPYRFSLDAVATLSYTLTVVDGPNVDLVATTERYAEAFASGGNWQFFEPASSPDTARADIEARLEPDDWVLILDNSGQGAAKPWGATPTPTGSPRGWRSGDATPTPTPQGEPATVQLEYAVRAGAPTTTSPNATTSPAATDDGA